jgi:uncharacterized membrane protein YfcA
MVFWIIATLLAFYIKGLCGFANTLVFTSVLSFSNANINISPVDLVLGIPSNLVITWKERKHINFNVCLPLALMVIAGSIFGIFFLKNADVTLIKIIFGVIVVLLGIEMLIREISKKQFKQSKVLLVFIGVLSGLMCGLYGVGALLGAYLGRVTNNAKEFKANICFIFIIENIFRTVMYSLSGIITLEVLKRSLMLAPLMALALVAGMISSKFIDEKYVKRIIIVLLIISGIALVVTNI